MKKSVFLKQKLDALKNDIKALQDENKIKEAHAKLSEVEDLRQQIAVAEALEVQEVEGFSGTPVTTPVQDVDHTVVFNKLVLGRTLTAAEQAFVNAAGTPGLVEAEDARGGYLVPEEQQTQIYELKRELVSLKPYCNVVAVGTKSGSMPLEVEASDKLINFEELNEINQGNPTFGNVAWSVADYGDIIPLSNSLLADEKANLTSYIGRRFSKKAVRTENEKIIAVFKTATKKAGTTYDAIKTALNKDLDPAIARGAVIVTNQTGYDWLDGMKDGQGHDLLQPMLSDPKKMMFRGCEIIVLSDLELTGTSGKYNFYVGSLEEMVAFFDRQGVVMAVSTDAGFTKNATMMRVIERFDVKAVDTKAMVNVEITPAP